MAELVAENLFGGRHSENLAVDAVELKTPAQAVVLCGGLGTRLMPHTANLPKPMIPCNGKPFLEYLLEQLSGEGIRDFLLLTGYMGDKIRNHFGNGARWNFRIEYSQGPVEWQTGKRLIEAKAKILDRFLLLYSDNFTTFRLGKAVKFHESSRCPLSLALIEKKPGNVALDTDGAIASYSASRSVSKAYVEIGYMIAERDETFSFFPGKDCDFSVVLEKMGQKSKLAGWVQNDVYHSISDPERWKRTEKYLLPKKIVLMDRDGIINRKASRGSYVKRWEEFEWIGENLNSMKRLSRKGFKFIVITNQAGIARGMVSQENLNFIHAEMKEVFRREGVEILDIYVCPHHWKEGCSCRKPEPGMLLRASRNFSFRLDESCFVGDDPRDLEAAEKAGCKGILWQEKQRFPSVESLVLESFETNRKSAS